ncbi:MAG: 3-methyl-2-oxobutanoate hydroxymethyltransferase [Gammaproteobacteria bacterium]|nr:MAG: 3-methyl-2-oxobutanoate hydroxymethyltransferase [Gammaproteobacteria bacterium]RLA23845.1 MAG: 3-methyl-2-oxobutanoate hydroxymethyltransferase [Gammaproteobacteria bacterium]
MTSKPLSVTSLLAKKQNGGKITCLTAYDASFSRVLDEAGVDVILVGDSLGMVIQGQESTLPVTVDEMVYHSRCVARGKQRAFLVTDLPFMSYATPDQAARNAARLMQEGYAQMVKLEGGLKQVETVRHLVDLGVPVCGHLGLIPQSVNQLGGYRVQGRDEVSANRIIEEAKALEAAGASMLVLECVPTSLANEITSQLVIPVIGIGAGVGCDGQVLVLYDMLDISFGIRPKFSRNFMSEADDVGKAVEAYVAAVQTGSFPAKEHSFE